MLLLLPVGFLPSAAHAARMDGEGCAFLRRRRNALAALSRLADISEYGSISAGGEHTAAAL